MFKPDDRVVVKVDKNEWYLGLVTGVTKKRISILFDDGATARVAEADWKDIRLASSTKKKRALTTEQARDIMIKRAPVAIKIKPRVPKSTPAQRAAAITFVPPGTRLSFDDQFRQMELWLRRVALIYKFDSKYVEAKKATGMVSLSRKFWSDEISPTHEKYKRAMKEMHDAFLASPLWRAQVFSGYRQFVSHDGLFMATIYDTDNPLGPGRALGFYIHLKPV